MGLLAAAHASVIKARQFGPQDILNYVCEGDSKGDMPEICKNMCYGVYCQGFSTSMYWDKPDRETSTARAKTAGCGSGNRCSKSPYGSGCQCDEFPFRSVTRPSGFLPVNRCVPSGQNRAQSNVLKQFYYSQGSYSGTGLGGQPGQFTLSFANYGDVKYCGFEEDCKNDGNQYNRNGEIADKKDSKRGAGMLNTYVTEKGQIIHVPGGAFPGDRVWTPDSYDEDLDFDIDFIVGPSNETVV